MKVLVENLKETSSSSSEDDIESSRLENQHWCKCGNPIIRLTFTLAECKRC